MKSFYQMREKINALIGEARANFQGGCPVEAAGALGCIEEEFGSGKGGKISVAQSEYLDRLQAEILSNGCSTEIALSDPEDVQEDREEIAAELENLDVKFWEII